MKILIIVLVMLLVLVTVFVCFLLLRTKDVKEVFNEEKKTIFTPPTGWVEEEGEWYYINEETFEKETGFIDVEGERYYLDPETGKKETGLLKLSEEEWYLLDNEGKLQRDCVVDSYVLDENGKALLTVKDIKDVNQLKIDLDRLPADKRKIAHVSIKANKDTPMEEITAVKQVLREYRILQLNMEVNKTIDNGQGTLYQQRTITKKKK